MLYKTVSKFVMTGVILITLIACNTDYSDPPNEPQPVLPISIVIQGESDVYKITDDRDTLQMEAIFTPPDTANKTVTWSIESNSTGASIGVISGVLTPGIDGEVTVKATTIAKNASGQTVENRKTIAVSGQTTKLPISIVIRGEGGVSTITADGAPLQMETIFTPSDTTNKTVTWSIENNSTGASIGLTSGVLTPGIDGNVIVKATTLAKRADGQAVEDTQVITVSGQTLTLEEKNRLYPFWDISLRALENESNIRNFTANEKEITLRIMTIIRFVLNTPEYEAIILAQTMKASRTINSRTTSERVEVGQILDPKRILRLTQDTMLETEIALADLASNVLGMGVAPNLYFYLEDQNHNRYPDYLQQVNNLVWIKFTSQYKIDDSLSAYANIGNTILHEIMHNLGFVHLASLDPSMDVAYVMGNIYERTLSNSAFLKKYENEFRKIVPYFEEKYSSFITHEPSLQQRNAAQHIPYTESVSTHSSEGVALTVIECIIENPEDYIKPFRHLVKDGQRMVDDFIVK